MKSKFLQANKYISALDQTQKDITRMLVVKDYQNVQMKLSKRAKAKPKVEERHLAKMLLII